jgi:hypothetical protein
MSKIIDFYLKEGLDSEGRSLEELLSWSDWAIETSHTTIQWLFPLKEPSNFNPDAPLLTDEDIAQWNERSVDGGVLRMNLADSFYRFLRFLGLVATWDDIGELKVVLADNFNERMPLIWERFNHNFLRITRCLASLRLLGLQPEADAFYKRLQALYESRRFPIPENTFNFWTEAVTGQPFSKRLGQ